MSEKISIVPPDPAWAAAFNAAIGERRFLRKRKNRVRTHHVHLVIFQRKFWKDSIRFRNLLRKDRRLAKRYEKLKLKYARLHENDREAYTNAKTPFVAKVLAVRKSGTGMPQRSKKKAHA